MSILLLFLVLLICCNLYLQKLSSTDNSCSTSNIDIVFLLDASPSVDSEEWSNSIEFVSKVVPVLSNANSRGSIFQYNDRTHLELDFTNDWVKLNSTLHSFTRNTDGNTNTATALQVVLKYLDSNARNESSTIIFLLTDGEPSDYRIDEVSKSIKEKGHVILIVAVDEARRSKTLMNVASSYDLFFPLEKFNQLDDNLISSIKNALCFNINYVSLFDKSSKNNFGFKSSLDINLLNSIDIFVNGTGIFDKTSCVFKSLNYSYTSDLINYNLTFGRCGVPKIEGDYKLYLHNNFRKNDTDSSISIRVHNSELVSTEKLENEKLCEGSYLTLQIKSQDSILTNSNLITNWKFKQDNHNFEFARNSSLNGCRNNNDCPFGEYCYDCELCKTYCDKCKCCNCGNCPTILGGQCTNNLEKCMTFEVYREDCAKISHPCDCITSSYKYSDDIFFKQEKFGCLEDNRCFVQNHTLCNLPSNNLNTLQNAYIRNCIGELDNEIEYYCHWSESNYNLQIPNQEVFDVFDGLINVEVPYTMLNFDYGIDLSTCKQYCFNNPSCSGVVFSKDGKFCYIIQNSVNTEEWKKDNRVMTLLLKKLSSKSIRFPAIKNTQNTFKCHVPKRFSFKSNFLNLIIERHIDNDFYSVSKSNFYRISSCSMCVDSFANNFDNTVSPNINKSKERCFYDSGLISKYLENEENKENSVPEYMYISKDYARTSSEEYSWIDLLTTKMKLYGYSLYIHNLNINSFSDFQLFLRIKDTNSTFLLFDTNLIDGSITNNLSKIKFISGDGNSYISDNIIDNVFTKIHKKEVSDAFKLSSDIRVIHALNKFLPDLNNNETTIQLGIRKRSNIDVDLQGITLIISDWAKPSQYRSQVIKSNLVKNCSVLNYTVFSQKQNRTVLKSEVHLEQTEKLSIPNLNKNELFFTLGCYKLYEAEWDVGMPAFIEDIQVIDKFNQKVVLIHDVLINEIYSEGKIDTARTLVYNLDEMLNIYEGEQQSKDNNLNLTSKNKFYLESEYEEVNYNDGKDFLAFKNGYETFPRLQVIIKDSKLLKGSFSYETKFNTILSAGGNTIGLQNKTRLLKSNLIREQDSFSWKYNKGISSKSAKTEKKLTFIALNTPISCVIKANANAYIKVSGEIDENIFNSKGSAATTVRIGWNMIKGTVTGDYDKFVNDFLPKEESRVTSTTIEIGANGEIGVSLLGIKAGLKVNLFNRGSTKERSANCGGNMEATHTSGGSLSIQANLPFIGEFKQDVVSCEKVLGSACGGGFIGSNLESKKITSISNVNLSLRNLKTGSMSCKTIQIVSDIIEYLDCLKPNLEGTIPSGAFSSDAFKCKECKCTDCKECKFSFRAGGGVGGDGDTGNWKSSSSHSQGCTGVDCDLFDEFYDDSDEGEDVSLKISSSTFGEPHIVTFGHQSYLSNEIGDFYLLLLTPPANGAKKCYEDQHLSQEEFELAKELENLYNGDYIKTFGVQIRFQQGAWAPNMTMSVAIAAQIREEKIEIQQLLNEPDFDIKLLVNDEEYNYSTILNEFKIRKIKGSTLKGNSKIYSVSSKYFTIKFSPFSVGVSLSPLITNTIYNGNACSIGTNGLVGAWEINSMRYRNGELLDGNFLTREVIKKYSNSWRVRPMENIISDWSPTYSDNSTISSDTPEIDKNGLDYLNSLKLCEQVRDELLKDQLNLLKLCCINPNLLKMKNMTDLYVEGCAYDYCLTKNKIFLDILKNQLIAIKLKEPVKCLSPNVMLKQRDIHVDTKNKFVLKIFDSEIRDYIKDYYPDIKFDMDIWSNSLTNYTINKENGTITFSDFKKDNLINITAIGVFTLNFTYNSYFDSKGLYQALPGQSYAKFALLEGNTKIEGWSIIGIILVILFIFVFFLTCFFLFKFSFKYCKRFSFAESVKQSYKSIN